MNIKRKLISVVTLSLMGSSAFATEAWSASDVSSYTPGTLVTQGGNTYKCKDWPEGAWCTIAAYEPTGPYGADAWEKTGPGPSPTPSEKITASVSIQGDLPTTAQIDFVSSKGTSTVSNGKVTLEYPKDDSETYTVKLKGDEGTISPSTVTVSAATTIIALTYTAKPAPAPGDCDTIPSNVAEFKSTDQGYWAGYSKKAFVKYDGSIYQLLGDWWTSKSPKETNAWTLCQAEEKATLDFTIPTKPSFITSDEKPSISIFNENDIKVAEVKNVAWGSKTKIDVPAGKLKVNVSTIGTSQGTATPSSFSIAKDETKNITVNYEQAQVGSINLTASADSNAIKSTTYTINNSSGDIVTQGEVNFTSATIIDNLPASEEGLKYTISAKSFTYGGYSYTAKPIVVTVTTGSRTDAQLNFTTEKVASAKVNVTIAGMPTGKQTTLHFTSNSGSSQLLEVSDNGVYTEELPKNGDTWTVTADKISGYKASITPSSFVADQNEQNVNLTFEQVAPSSGWPDRAVVGYVRGYDAPWYSQPDTTNEMITEAMKRGYNVIVYAFAGQDFHGNVDGEQIDIDGVGYVQFSDNMKARVPEQQKIIHDNGGISLLSIGGGINYFTPDMNNDAEGTGKAMGKFLADNGFDGLDVDVEHPTNGAEKEDNFIAYINAMKAEYMSITGKMPFLTAAPQINGWYGTGQWASGSASFAEAMYTQQFMDDAQFDAVFIQTYNQYGGANFGGKKGYDVGFLSMTFNLLSPETRDKMPGITEDAFYVPKETKIVLGVPDFKDPSVSESEYQVGSCLATAKCSGVGLYNPADITKDITDGNLKQYNQYGGVMTWILNSDSYQNWTWVDGVKDVAYN
ncbi:glycosyl hydrolase family 18 protein [Allofrancisella inopinata]|nr:glycosyl hydrolase family 18 protein [Allofrancisella inopinata]